MPALLCSSAIAATRPTISLPPALQALCCMSPGCVYASIKREEKTVDYIVYKVGWLHKHACITAHHGTACSACACSAQVASPGGRAAVMRTDHHLKWSMLSSSSTGEDRLLLLPHVQQRQAEGQRLAEHLHQEGQVGPNNS